MARRIPIVDSIDKRNGLIISAIAMGLLVLFLMLMSFSFPDPPPKDIPLEMAEAIPMEEMVIEDLTISGGQGSGDPSDAPVKPNEPQTENILTNDKEDTKTENTGQSNTTNAPSSNNTPSTTQQSDNPFAPGGTGGGTSGGDGDGFGQDSGSSGSGTGGQGGTGKGRVRLNEVNVDNIQIDVDATLSFKLTVDEKGNVVNVMTIKAQTTTSDQNLINKIAKAIKQQVKFNTAPGSAMVKQFYTVKVRAS